MKERHREADRMCDELHFARGDSMIAVDHCRREWENT